MYRRPREGASDTKVPVPGDTGRMRRSMLRPPCAIRSPRRSGATRPSSGSGARRRSRSSDRSSRGSRCRWPPSSSSARVRSRSRSCAAWSSSPRSSSGWSPGAWVDRLRRRPVLIWADLGRAALLGSIPVAFAFGVLTFVQLLIVSALAAILTTFFDSADNAYLPIDRRARPAGRGQRRAGGQRVGRRVHRLRDQRLPRPVAHRTDRHRGRRGQLPRVGAPPRPRSAARRRRRRRARTASPCCPRSATAFASSATIRSCGRSSGAQMSLAALWGIFGATWFLFVLDELRSRAGRIGRHRRGRWLLVVHRRDGRDPVDARASGSVPWRSSRCCSRRSATRSSRWRRPGCRWSRSAASSCSSWSPIRRRPSTTSPRSRSASRWSATGRSGGSRRRSTSRRSSPSWWRRSVPGCWPRRSGCARRRGWRRSAGWWGRRSCGSRRSATCWCCRPRPRVSRRSIALAIAVAAEMEQPPGA